MTSPQFEIRAFAQRIAAKDAEELFEQLTTQFAGQSVSIVFPQRPTGLLKVIYVDVSQSGRVTESYGQMREVRAPDIADLVMPRASTALR